MSSETVYLKLPQITEVYERDVYVKDVGEVHCQNKSVEAKVKAVKVTSFPDTGKKGTDQVCSVLDLIEKIEKTDSNIQVNNVGEADFVIKYKPSPRKSLLFQWLKTVFVAAVAFSGAAFAIMTFNNDASINDVFANLYQVVLGAKPQGVSVLEISYSIGLAAGILVFFNHFAGWKITVDPTPIEVEMRLYEENLNKTLIQNDGRKESGIDVF